MSRHAIHSLVGLGAVGVVIAVLWPRAKAASGDVDFNTVTASQGNKTDVWTAGSEYLDWLSENGLQDTAATKKLFQQRVLTSS